MYRGYQGHHAADDDHRLAAAAELVHGESRHPHRSSMRWSAAASASSTSTRCRCYLREQELAGLDIVTDGDCRFDEDVGGQSWTSYPPHHMSGFEHANPKLATPSGRGGLWFPRGHILHDYLEARVMPTIVGPVGRGDMQYAEMWKTAQRLTKKPVKFGTVTAEMVAFAVAGRALQERARAHPGDQPTPSTRSCTTSPTPAAR